MAPGSGGAMPQRLDAFLAFGGPSMAANWTALSCGGWIDGVDPY